MKRSSIAGLAAGVLGGYEPCPSAQRPATHPVPVSESRKCDRTWSWCRCRGTRRENHRRIRRLAGRRVVHIARLTNPRNKVATALDWSTSWFYNVDAARFETGEQPKAVPNRSVARRTVAGV
jgi:hypothetical protein